MSANRASIAFGGTERFVLEGQLGEGGMGVVYRARDRESTLPIALKTMSYVEPSALLRFKKEFRALSDISHPNVVQLYEMISAGEHWFFTMELLDGVDFLRWVRVGEQPLSDFSSPTVDASPFPHATRAASGPGFEPSASPGASCDLARLRPALKQLAEGVMAIHAAGKLHRDIKPSNVMVTREGRVVLLDFGVVADLPTTREKPRLEDQILGTPAYMAPEQARGVAPGAAADWYAIGVMLYEALTGQLPFQGSPHDILFNKQGTQAIPPSVRAPGVPPDLDALCLDLLETNANKRPLGADVLRRLSASEGRPRSTPPASLASSSQRPFVGRQEQLAELADAFHGSASSTPTVVLLSGRSGMGKTALAQHFLDQARQSHGALVLSGRCFEREALPFKGMDSVIDELGQYLISTPPPDIGDALPADLHYLIRVFPVLRAVPCFHGRIQPEHEVIEPSELRKRAFAALKALLTALAARRPLVLHIDDAQWSDIDSLVLLESLLQPPQPARFLLVCAFRAEPRTASPVLRELSRMLDRMGAFVNVRELELAPLSEAEAIQLAGSALREGSGSPSELARAIAVESRGVPMFVSELAEWQLERGALTAGNRESAPNVSLEQLIQSRVGELPEEARRLLALVSVANGPLPFAIAEEAAGIGRSEALRARLRGARLVRTNHRDDREYVETYHARVRDSVMVTLDGDQRRGCHGALALALEQSGQADPEALVEHYLGAGNPGQARRHVLVAARAAENGLAFLRAARLYRVGLEIGVDRPQHELWAAVGDALVAAGHSAEAAEAYAEAGRSAAPDAALELQRRAAEHYLKSGLDREGLEMLRRVLQGVGLNYAPSSTLAVTSLLYHRARLGLRGLSFRQRPLDRCPPRELTRVDVAFSATSGLAMVDPIRGADFGTQHLQLALEVGEPMRICRALALEAGNAAAVLAGSADRVERLMRTAETLARHTQDPHGAAWSLLGGGLVQVFSGHWRAAQRMLDEAETIFRERCRGVTWELTNAQAWSCNSLILRGDLPAAATRMPALLHEANERSDRYALMHLIYPACITRLAADDVAEDWRVASDDSTFRSFEPGRFTAGHWGRLISTQSVHRYRGEGQRARVFVEGEWRALEASQFLRVHLMRVFSQFERALSFIAALDDGAAPREVAREAERLAKRVHDDRPRYAAPLGDYLMGCLAAARGDAGRALAALQRAALGLEAADMGYLALCARQRCAELLGGDSGRESSERCRLQFSQRGIVNVAACLNMSAPGFRRLCA